MITVNNIKVSLDSDESALKKAVELKLKTNIKTIKILHRAIDARKKDNIIIVYKVEVSVDNEHKFLSKNKDKDVYLSDTQTYSPPYQLSKRRYKTVVVGSGPAGLFCAYILALRGGQVILIERGKAADERKKAVEFFKKTGILDTETNIQFGEGGAGTFSDGKLNTGIKDKRIYFVLETFAEFAEGKADDILYNAKPHLGTDRLIDIVKNMRQKIISLGGSVRFGCKLTDILTENNVLTGVKCCNNGISEEISCDNLVLAIGHSARDTVKMLYEHGVFMEQKPFAMGVRIEHKREMIDKSQYGKFAGHKNLGTADYKISCKTSEGRGVYSFCMCPGGYVVPASSENGMLAVNGMSEFARNADNSNSALLVGISPNDFGSSHPLAGMELQRKTEKAAFNIAGGYKAPVQLVGDLISLRASNSIGDIVPSYLPGFEPCDLRACLPGFIIDSIRLALPAFGKMINGFDTYDAVLTGVESRSSSPVRICRNSETLQCNIKGVYPCGEGAGYAGGIVSAACDGIKCAEKILLNG